MPDIVAIWNTTDNQVVLGIYCLSRLVVNSYKHFRVTYSYGFPMAFFSHFRWKTTTPLYVFNISFMISIMTWFSVGKPEGSIWFGNHLFSLVNDVIMLIINLYIKMTSFDERFSLSGEWDLLSNELGGLNEIYLKDPSFTVAVINHITR